ncbi:hypothetical protein NSK_008198 [Nannochloropsis salina CCMP1776]|uniref:Uncharacterized protein n=1 Tax=Nannochloropsis salina CCMP1776 TaxID=1027361 RepID=A0A4D9CR13_9STRA|nr:hypothetical protein NSK_008198 [Nannochloropsis salina CCMP1776]|eukprot:TFJ80457.1 hypothetical protein NSK_008198 [Nannochloropsis salina CCMP1776]
MQPLLARSGNVTPTGATEGAGIGAIQKGRTYTGGRKGGKGWAGRDEEEKCAKGGKLGMEERRPGVGVRHIALHFQVQREEGGEAMNAGVKEEGREGPRCGQGEHLPCV